MKTPTENRPDIEELLKRLGNLKIRIKRLKNEQKELENELEGKHGCSREGAPR